MTFLVSGQLAERLALLQERHQMAAFEESARARLTLRATRRYDSRPKCWPAGPARPKWEISANGGCKMAAEEPKKTCPLRTIGVPVSAAPTEHDIAPLLCKEDECAWWLRTRSRDAEHTAGACAVPVIAARVRLAHPAHR
jgi:hypothetical protein